MFESWLTGAQNYFNNIIIAIAILLVGFGLGTLTKKFFLKLFQEVELNQILEKINLFFDLENFLSTFLAYIVYFFTLTLVLKQLGLTSGALFVLLGIILIITLLIFLSGTKDIIPNLFGWIYLRKAKLKIGQLIEINGISGKIEKISLVETIIKTNRGDILHVPNALLKDNYKLKKIL